MDARKVLERNKIVEMYAGSRAYGTNLPTSDVDIRGVFVADPVSIRTPFFHLEEVEIPGEHDVKFFELNKFMKLLIEQNPNIVELLWTNGSDVIVSSPAFEMLRQERGNLLTSKIAATTVGYATSQIRRIKGHNRWISNPQPKREPEQLDFTSVVYNFTNYREWNKKVPFDGFSALELGDDHYGLFRDDGKSWRDKRGNPILKEKSYFDGMSSYVLQVFTKKGRTPDLVVKVNKRQFQEAHENWKNYWNWKENRNTTRSVLEERHGYDTKHALHCVRLLRMGHEALTEGVIRVKRPDAKELLSIRAGAWTYEEVVEYAEHMNNEVEKAVQTTQLPKSLNMVRVANLVMSVQNMVW